MNFSTSCGGEVLMGEEGMMVIPRGGQRLPWLWTTPDGGNEEGGGRRRIEDDDHHSNESEEASMAIIPTTEREHMFDKVVTPSDVGKLNRLVIPKQHAEKYFPLDSSSSSTTTITTTTNEKGLLLNFEDRNGKPWRFRYSYWNSSQSYVMTKGWSRFVKEKKLDAGDTVSFHRGVGEIYKSQLYIDWRPRHFIPSMVIPPHHHHHLLLRRPQPWTPVFLRRQRLADNPYHQTRLSTGFLYPSSYPQQQMDQVQIQSAGKRDEGVVRMESSNNSRGNAVPKRFRLFGVNMECSIPQESTTSLNSFGKGKGTCSTLDFNILECQQDEDNNPERWSL